MTSPPPPYDVMQQFYCEFLNNLPEDKFERYYGIMIRAKNLYRRAPDSGSKERYKRDYEEAAYQLRSLGYKVTLDLDSNIVPGIRPEILEPPKEHSCKQNDTDGILNDGDILYAEVDVEVPERKRRRRGLPVSQRVKNNRKSRSGRDEAEFE